MGTATASAGAAGPSEGLWAGRSVTASGLSRSERTTRPCDLREQADASVLFRHKRRMELVELSGRITGRLGYDYRLRHRRDCIAGTTILYHLRIYRRPHSPSGTTAGRRELLGMGTAAASAGAAGPSEGLRAGRSSGRTKPEYTAPSGRHDHATTGAGRRVSPTTGTRSQTTCYVRRGTGRV